MVMGGGVGRRGDVKEGKKKEIYSYWKGNRVSLVKKGLKVWGS